MSQIAQHSLQVAISQLGVEEVPRNSNSGPQVSAYLRSVGHNPGAPWCMAFVYWCVNEACKNISKETGTTVTNPLVRTAGVLRQWQRTTLRKLPRTSRAVKPGDIFIQDWGRGKGHTGFVEKVTGSVVHTIEGNTNDEGSREGFEVCRRQRSLTSILGFIQL